MKRFVLAYSGGLDTSCILRWLQERHDAEVITFTADLGQKKELRGVREKAAACGAARVLVEDLREEFVRDYVWPALKAGALYQGTYPLATALGRPLIAKRLAEIAHEVGADAIVHGCTGKGNDQVRIETSVAALAPQIARVAPLREWELKTRDEEIAWARARGIPVAATAKAPYSIDENLWGVAIEAGALEDPWAAPPDDCWQVTRDPGRAPRDGATVVVSFERGVPVALDGEPLAGAALVERIGALAAEHGVGRIDVIEDRLVGIKSREVYEAPAAVALHTAREALERLTLGRETRRTKAALGQELARLVYDGLWFTPLRESIGAFVENAVRPVTGDVRLALTQGRAFATGSRSPNALYDATLATYGAGDTFRHAAAAGFIEIFSLGARTAGAVARRRGPRQEAATPDRARRGTAAPAAPAAKRAAKREAPPREDQPAATGARR
jgi:argininosuccinate synthase